MEFFRSRVPVYVDDAERLLAGHQFGPDQWDAPLRSLSAGELRRLLLAVLVNSPQRVLLLDEPTNFLDFDALDVVEEALRRYRGTLLFVTHDRYFAAAVGSHPDLACRGRESDGELRRSSACHWCPGRAARSRSAAAPSRSPRRGWRTGGCPRTPGPRTGGTWRRGWPGARHGTWIRCGRRSWTSTRTPAGLEAGRWPRRRWPASCPGCRAGTTSWPSCGAVDANPVGGADRPAGVAGTIPPRSG